MRSEKTKKNEINKQGIGKPNKKEVKKNSSRR
jgi:hypothetical protein